MYVPAATTVAFAVLQISMISSISLSLQLFALALVLDLVMLTTANILVVVEDDRTYGLFGAILADYVIVYAPLQIARVELGDAKASLVGKYRASAILLVRIIA